MHNENVMMVNELLPYLLTGLIGGILLWCLSQYFLNRYNRFK